MILQYHMNKDFGSITESNEFENYVALQVFQEFIVLVLGHTDNWCGSQAKIGHKNVFFAARESCCSLFARSLDCDLSDGTLIWVSSERKQPSLNVCTNLCTDVYLSIRCSIFSYRSVYRRPKIVCQTIHFDC